MTKRKADVRPSQKITSFFSKKQPPDSTADAVSPAGDESPRFTKKTRLDVSSPPACTRTTESLPHDSPVATSQHPGVQLSAFNATSDVAPDVSSHQGNNEAESEDDSFSAAPVLHSGTVTMSQLPPRATKPFRMLDVYGCPYVDTGNCSHKSGLFQTFRGLVQHIDMFHPKGNIVAYDVSQVEDGTRKIPCPKGCGHLSVTHQQANQHAKVSTCTASVQENIICPWKPYNGCNKVVKSAKAMASHAATHRNDVRSPYMCAFNGCGVHHADLYKLAMHQERCEHRQKAAREPCYRFPLTSVAESGTPPELIIINRSSSHPPKSWMALTNDIKKGLPLIGKEILTEYVTMSGSQAESAVLHSCSNCSTRELPAVPVDEPIINDTLHLRLARHRAMCFTNAITQDIKAANEAGLVPTLLSVGLDGWVCNERKLLPWLQASELEFNLVLRLNGLHFGMSDKFVKQNANSYWVRYNINDIQRALENGPGLDEKTDELLACWKVCQAGKDNSFGVNVGRNNVNIKKSEN